MQSCKICIFHSEPPPNLSKDSVGRKEISLHVCGLVECNIKENCLARQMSCQAVW